MSLRVNLQTRKKNPTFGKRCEFPFHLWENHPSLSHPCFLLSSSERPSPSRPAFENSILSEAIKNVLLLETELNKQCSSIHTDSTRMSGSFLGMLLRSSTGDVGVNLPRAARRLAEPRWCWGRWLPAVQPAALLEPQSDGQHASVTA